MRFRPTPEMATPSGQIQGGILAGMLDNLVGPAAHSAAPDRIAVTVSLTVNFIAAAQPGDVLVGHADVIKAGRLQMVVEARLEREADNKLIAKASAINIFREKPTGA
jgi:uncharacterized protein (TIGR00369 family)